MIHLIFIGALVLQIPGCQKDEAKLLEDIVKQDTSKSTQPDTTKNNNAKPDTTKTDTTKVVIAESFSGKVIYVQNPGTDRDIRPNLATAVSKAVNGDMIILPEGKFSYNGSLTINKLVSLKGAGKSKTILYRPESTPERDLLFKSMINYEVWSDVPSNVVISDFTLKGKMPSIKDGDGKSTVRDIGLAIHGVVDFVVSRCRFENFGECGIQVVHKNQLASGLIFNCDFYRNCKGENGQGTGYGIHVRGNSSDWVKSPMFGTKNFIFIEDNTFEYHRHSIASDGGALYVARYNTILNNLISHAIDMHGIDDLPISTRATEIYNNTIEARYQRYNHSARLVGAQSESNIPDFAIGIRGGESLVYNNTVTNYNHVAVMMMEQTYTGKYPEFTQIGYASGSSYGSNHKGTNATYGNGDCYFWNNKWNNLNPGNGYADIYYESDGLSPKNMILENRDWHRVAKPGYTSYTYPHPLRK